MSYPEPRYGGTSGELSAVIRPGDREPDLRLGEAVRIGYLANGASTGRQFGLYRWDSGPRSFGAAPHFHRTMSESFFVISGNIELYDGKEWVATSPGDFGYVPEGGIHGFRNDSDEPASMLILFVPGAPREGYFEAIAERVAGRHFTDEEWIALCERHDNYFV